VDAHVPERAQVGGLSAQSVNAAVLTAAMAFASAAVAAGQLCSPAAITATAASLEYADKAYGTACRALPSLPGQTAMALVFVRPGTRSAEYVLNPGILDLAVVVVGEGGGVLRRFSKYAMPSELN
jgi:hypothetical protein